MIFKILLGHYLYLRKFIILTTVTLAQKILYFKSLLTASSVLKSFLLNSINIAKQAFSLELSELWTPQYMMRATYFNYILQESIMPRSRKVKMRILISN